MRKSLLALAVFAGAAAAGYYAYNHQASGLNQPMLSYVPADTVFFAGQFEAIDQAQMLKAMGLNKAMFERMATQMQEQLAQGEHDMPPLGQFAFAALTDVLSVIDNPSKAAELGFGQTSRSVAYFVGALPVAMVEVADPSKTVAWLIKQAKDHNLTVSEQSIKGQNYSNIALLSEDGFDLNLSLVVREKWLTVTLTHQKQTEAQIAAQLGIDKPADSLLQAGTLTTLAKRYKLSSQSIGYVDFSQIVKGLLSTDQNRLARDLQAWLPEEAKVGMAQMQSPACLNDALSIASNWPYLLIDSKVATGKTIEASSRMIIAGTDQATMTELQKARGYIPSLLTTDSGPFSVALGIDVAELSTVVNYSWKTLTNAKWSCEPLVAMQQQMKANNPMMAMMATSMASGIQGAAVNLNAVDYDFDKQAVSEADGFISFAIKDARSFVEGIKSFAPPPFAELTLPEVGQSLALKDSLPMLGALGLDPKLTFGQDIAVVYIGDKAAAQVAKLTQEKVAKNGIYQVHIDYAFLFSKIKSMAELQGEPIPDEVNDLLNMNIKTEQRLDITNDGIELSGKVLF